MLYFGRIFYMYICLGSSDARQRRLQLLRAQPESEPSQRLDHPYCPLCSALPVGLVVSTRLYWWRAARFFQVSYSKRTCLYAAAIRP